MIGQCMLDPELNKCPYFVTDSLGCKKDNTICGFFKSAEKEKVEIDHRENKWFEKYYK